MERKIRARAESAAFIGIVALGLILVNILAIRYFVRVDLTKRQLFTLSQGTRRIMGRMTDQLAITVYFTPNQPPPANDDERTLRDQLDEYRSLARGRVNIRFVATDNEARRAEADRAGCEKRALQAVNAREAQATIQEVHRCVTFEYIGRRDKIAFLTPGVQGLEYEITSIIRNLTAPESERERTIGFLAGHGEQTPEEGMQYLTQLMEQERVSYRVRSINLNNGENPVPTDIRGLIIANPVRRIEERELRQIDAYLMRGGSVAVFAGGVGVTAADPTSATGTAAEHHLNDLLDGYGLHLDTNLILDPRSSDGVIRMGRSAARVRLVTWPLIPALSGTPSDSDLRSNGGLDPEFPAVFRLPEFISTYPSSITVREDVVRRSSGVRLRQFARTSPRSVRRTDDFDVNIVEILQQGENLFTRASSHGPYVVGAAIEGRFRSAFARAAGAPPAETPPAVTAPERAERDARIMVISSGNIFALESLRLMAQLSGGRPGNITLLFNTFDWLSQDLDLLAVRAKDTSDPTLRADVSTFWKDAFKWGSVVLLPLAIGAIGVAVLSARRSRRRKLASQLGIKG